jgi:hypothetical protein
MDPSIFTSGQDPLWNVFERLAVELAVLIIILPVIYRRFANNKEHLFPFFLMGIMIFLVCVLLKRVEIQMGMVLGLFAIFSILRFRTYNFSTKDMSYLFAVIGLSAINAMFDFPRPILGTSLFNLIVILSIFGLESYFKGVSPAAYIKSEKKKKKGEKKSDKKSDKKLKKKKSEKAIQLVYDNLKLLQADKSEDLLADLSIRTGKIISEVEIRRIDLINGTAVLRVYSVKKTAGVDHI